MAPRNTHIELPPADCDRPQTSEPRPFPTATTGSRPRPVVVGVDKSEASLTALCWAAAEAHRRAAELIIVHAWSVTPAFGYYPNGIIPRRDVNREAATTLDRAVSVAHNHGIPATARLVEGDAVDVLVHAAEHADLLVVGHPDHHRLIAALHCSTASRCTRRAKCPVVAVPADTPHPPQQASPATNTAPPADIGTTQQPAVTSASQDTTSATAADGDRTAIASTVSTPY
jgi:nucleotide-binding universal stress UspA family protein